jgi:pilus assembly protein CpaF
VPYLLIQEYNKYVGKTKVNEPRMTIGKARNNDCVLDRPDISSQHCELFQYNNQVMVRDLNSKNGTFVDGTKITSPVSLKPGMSIGISSIILTYQGDDKSDGAMEGETPTLANQSLMLGTLKQKIHSRLWENKELKQLDITDEQKIKSKIETVAQEIIQEMQNDIPSWVDKNPLLKDICDEALGLGPIEALLRDSTITEIMVNNWDKIYIEREGKLELTNRQFTSNEQVLNVIRRIVAPIGRRIDESSPMVDARLKDGSRVNAIIHPLAISGPTLTIRKFSKTPYTMNDLEKFGTLSHKMNLFIQLCVEKKRNICITGGTGTGKTTLLNAVSGFISEKERIVTIEDAAELRLHQQHVVTLESKPPNIEGKGAVSIRKLVINSLRMRPDRIIVGECRGGEAFDMLQAMNTGHDGSLTTVHANSPRDGIARMENMVLMAEMNLPARSIRQQISSAIHLIIQLARLPDGSRRIVQISEITGMEGEVITMQDIFTFKQTGHDTHGKITGEFIYTGVMPKFFEGLRRAGISLPENMFGQEV